VNTLPFTFLTHWQTLGGVPWVNADPRLNPQRTSGGQTTVGDDLSARSPSPARSERSEGGDRQDSESVDTGKEGLADHIGGPFGGPSRQEGGPPSYPQDLPLDGNDGSYQQNLAEVKVSSGRRDCRPGRWAAPPS
jgi:hypothetical protein